MSHFCIRRGTISKSSSTLGILWPLIVGWHGIPSICEAAPHRGGVAPTFGMEVVVYGDTGLALRITTGMVAAFTGPRHNGLHTELILGPEYDLQDRWAWSSTVGVGGARDVGPCGGGFAAYLPFPAVAVTGGIRSSHQGGATSRVGLIGVHGMTMLNVMGGLRGGAMAILGDTGASLPAMFSYGSMSLANLSQDNCGEVYY